VRALVDQGRVKGATRQIKIAAARRAVTVGTAKGYLRIEGDSVHWVPGAYENTRLQKKL
jgi:hypothetical protein